MTWPFACRCMFFLHLNRASGFCNCEGHPVQPRFRYLSAAGPSPLPHSSTLNNHWNWLIAGVRLVFIRHVIFTEHRLISAEGESERWEARGTEQMNGLVYLLVLIQPALFPSEQGVKVFRWAFHTVWPSSPDLRLIISPYMFASLPVPRMSMLSPVWRVCRLIEFKLPPGIGRCLSWECASLTSVRIPAQILNVHIKCWAWWPLWPQPRGMGGVNGSGRGMHRKSPIAHWVACLVRSMSSGFSEPLSQRRWRATKADDCPWSQAFYTIFFTLVTATCFIRCRWNAALSRRTSNTPRSLCCNTSPGFQNRKTTQNSIIVLIIYLSLPLGLASLGIGFYFFDTSYSRSDSLMNAWLNKYIGRMNTKNVLLLMTMYNVLWEPSCCLDRQS